MSMRRAECVGNLNRNVEGVVERQRAFLQPVGQRLAFEIFHDEKRRALLFADVVEGADVWMCELRDRAGFTIEAFAKLPIGSERFRNDFDRDRAIEPGVSRFVDLTHAAGPEDGDDLVRPEADAGVKGHGSAVDYTGGSLPTRKNNP